MGRGPVPVRGPVVEDTWLTVYRLMENKDIETWNVGLISAAAELNFQ